MNIKKMILTASIAMFAFGVNAQDQNEVSISQDQAPLEAVKTFNEEFASAKDVDWKVDGNFYEAEFTVGDKEKTAHFDRSGELKYTSTEINRSELPQAVNQTLNQNYRDYELNEFYKVEKEGKIKYKVKAEKGGESKKLMFDSSGNKIEKDKKHHKS